MALTEQRGTVGAAGAAVFADAQQVAQQINATQAQNREPEGNAISSGIVNGARYLPTPANGYVFKGLQNQLSVAQVQLASLTQQATSLQSQYAALDAKARHAGRSTILAGQRDIRDSELQRPEQQYRQALAAKR